MDRDPSLLHLLAELERVDVLLRLRVEQARRLHPSEDAWAGLTISDEEVDNLLDKGAGLPAWATTELDGPTQMALAELERRIAGQRAAWLGAGATLRLDELARRFALSAFERDVVLVCLAPEIDLGYERLYAYLHDDVTRKRPSVDLVLNLLCPTLEAKLAARAAFAAHAPLRRHHLLELVEETSRPAPPLLARHLRLDPRVVSYLFGRDDLDEGLEGSATLVEPAVRLADLVLPRALRRTLESLAGDESEDGLVLYLQGPRGVGKQSTAEALCQRRGLKLLVIDLRALLEEDTEAFRRTLKRAAREAVLQGAALCWRHFDVLLGDAAAARQRLVVRTVLSQRSYARWSFLTGQAAWEPGTLVAPFLRLELPPLTGAARAEIWTRHLGGELGRGQVQDLASRFHLDGGQIRDAATTAGRRVRARGEEGSCLSLGDLEEACRLHSNPNLRALAQKITPRYRWHDLVLPADHLEQLREIGHHVRYRARVYDAWGFEHKLALGKGVGILFSGPSGTGKTMAADVLAGDLGLELYKIDLATVVSKYIGETEKNLSHLFDEAETANAVLFFDEADALFGKRSEVRDSHDRYANLEVGYLLQRMEAYRGVVILATNLADQLDEAFTRRLHFTLEFPFPDRADRRRIWQGIWPDKVPRSSDVDLDFMAERFAIAGGNIKNVALAAAFLAAADGGRVGMEHLLHATRREYRKMGRLALAGEFER